MLTDFRVSIKTKPPACCSFDCCGNKFGRIESHGHAHPKSINRIKLSRRYAKRVERQLVRRLILAELIEIANSK